MTVSQQMLGWLAITILCSGAACGRVTSAGAVPEPLTPYAEAASCAEVLAGGAGYRFRRLQTHVELYRPVRGAGAEGRIEYLLLSARPGQGGEETPALWVGVYDPRVGGLVDWPVSVSTRQFQRTLTTRCLSTAAGSTAS